MDNNKKLSVELRYDPVRPASYVSINGKDVDGGDIYGFLYPVRGCALQAWLWESGSWPGLRRELEELGRDEPLELVFMGRECDFKDVGAALVGAENIALSFKPWEWDYQRPLSEVTVQLRDLLDGKIELDMSFYRMNGAPSRSFADLFPESAQRARALLETASATSGDGWIAEVRTPAELRAARGGDGCVKVYESAIGSLENLSSLRALTGSMQRSADMVVCVTKTPEKQREFEAYAAQFPGPRPLFTWENGGTPAEQLLKKYAEPLGLRRRVEAARGACQELTAVRGQKKELERQVGGLTGSVIHNSREAGELNRRRMALRWIIQRGGKLDKLTDTASQLSASLKGDKNG